ncbi:DUF4184 family protein [Amorphoplanes digitatis]|uniref:DUF4184 family protein n=1 Tax=Actinoplanes digitatis TaxID=1868 RepID=A0A7W7I575_9ACTN|nr:DUF4184 family protein [Actinoplanes digitatis]MBB4766677.1 hypothetical protein [Actinoplanes digitatis]GID96179.1 hypothetical protein Adi01nite_55910 [Actinoplanes digitatis]
MPLTFPSHPATVLPLKLWRPRWFDGVALAIGSMAPDLAYALDGTGLPVWPLSHQPAGLIAWCLPLTLALTWLIRRAAPVLAGQLPVAGPLALRDYGALGESRHRWPITVSSALLGAASHLILDRIEFAAPATENVMHVLGAVTLAAVAVNIGRHRLLRRWHGDPPPRQGRPAVFWAVAAGVALPLVALIPFLPGATLAHTSGARLLCAVGLGLLTASLLVAASRNLAAARP